MSDEEKPASNPFTDHLDQCQRCRDHPFDLCPRGARLLKETAMTLVVNPFANFEKKEGHGKRKD